MNVAGTQRDRASFPAGTQVPSDEDPARNLCNQRNYAVMSRRGEEWFAEWELERSGRTPAMALGRS